MLLEPSTVLPAGEVVVQRAHIDLDPLPRVVAVARSFVSGQCPELTAERRDVLLLLTSEVVTNAVIHARTLIGLGVTLTDRSVLVTVHDGDLGRSELPGPDRHGGRGLALVALLADATRTERHPGDGKTVWFRLSLIPHP